MNSQRSNFDNETKMEGQSDYCSCCLSKSGTMLDMQTTEVSVELEQLSYLTFYHFCMGYEVPHNIDKTPKICIRCSVKLEDSYFFIKNSMKVYEILRTQIDSKTGIELVEPKVNNEDQKPEMSGEWWPMSKPLPYHVPEMEVKRENLGIYPEPELWDVAQASHSRDQTIFISDDDEQQPDMEIDMDLIEQKYQPQCLMTSIEQPSGSQSVDDNSWFTISLPREIREDARTTRSQTRVLEVPEENQPSVIESTIELEIDRDLIDNGIDEPAAPENASPIQNDGWVDGDDDEEEEEVEAEPIIYDFKCRLCPETFKTSKVLATHVKLHREKTGAECLDCKIKFTIFYDVTVHLRECHRGKKKVKPLLRCLQCEVPPFKSDLALKIHLLKKHYHRPSTLKFHDFHICKDCGQKFNTSNALYTHRKKNHTMLRVFKCPQCTESFVLEHHMQRHFATIHSTERNFKCAHCPEACRTKGDLERHIREHVGGKPDDGTEVVKRRRRVPNNLNPKNECPECGKCFKYRCYLDIHLKRHQQPGFLPRKTVTKIRCAKCPFSFSTEEAVLVHLKFHSEQTRSECLECNIPFPSYNDLNVHLKIYHKPGTPCPAPALRCSQCVKPTFKNAFALKLHLLKRHQKKCTHTTDGSTCRDCELSNSSCVRCKLCAATFRNKASLDMHLKRHLTSRILKFRCPQCSKSCGNDGILKIHMQFHSENTRSECVKCTQKYASYFELAAHLKVAHENDQDLDLGCSQCINSSFKTAFGLRCHLHKMHLTTKSQQIDLLENKCPQCQKIFSNRGVLNHHIATVHCEEKKFVCPICSAKFKTNYNLKMHANAHQGVQNYKCSRCPATFRLALQLTRHIKQHLIERRAEREKQPKGPKLRFRCKFPGCFKSYNFKSSLDAHASFHKTERDFVCPQCPSTFKTKSHLDRHVKRHAFRSQFLKCTQCTVYCMNEPSLKTHILLHSNTTSCECIDCDLKMPSYNDLASHCKTDHKSVDPSTAQAAHPTVKCSQCDEPPFQNIFTLKCHILKQHLQESILTATTNLDTQCEICKKQFLYPSEVKVHMQVHTKERNFRCKLCSAFFKTSFALGIHLKRHLETKSLKNRCAICSLYCGSEAALATHTKLHSEKTGSECLECAERCGSYNDLMTHVKNIHHPESANPMPMLKCNRCELPHFKNLFALKIHFLKKHSRTCKHSTDDMCQECEALERTFRCKLCPTGNMFKSKFSLDLHLKRHLTSNVLKYRCTQCSKRCIKEASLKTHMVYHSAITAGDCLGCNMPFQDFNSLAAHIKQEHTENSSPSLKCRACDSVFKNLLGFKLHLMRIHLEAQLSAPDMPEVKCQEPGCDKLFTSKAGLNTHMTTVHSDVRKFECTMCPMKFKQSGHLKVHLTTHSDERNFKCDQCPGAFKTQFGLNKHLRKHLRPGFVPRLQQGIGATPMLVPRRPRGRVRDENENHECPTCGRDFKFRHQLQNHVTIHSDLRNFICELCSMAFKTNKHLQVHLKRHQKKSFMKYKCEICASICKNQFTLRKHMKLHSDQTPSECMECAEKFPSYFQLIDHLKAKHDGDAGNRTFKCCSCQADDKGIYRTIETLRKHILNEH